MSGGDTREARYTAKGSRGSAMTRMNAEKSMCDGSMLVDSAPAGRFECDRNGSTTRTACTWIGRRSATHEIMGERRPDLRGG